MRAAQTIHNLPQNVCNLFKLDTRSSLRLSKALIKLERLNYKSEPLGGTSTPLVLSLSTISIQWKVNLQQKKKKTMEGETLKPPSHIDHMLQKKKQLLIR